MCVYFKSKHVSNRKATYVSVLTYVVNVIHHSKRISALFSPVVVAWYNSIKLCAH